MRELANSSARQNIAKHHKRRYWENAIIQIAVCATALFVSGYLLTSSKGYPSTMFFAGCATASMGCAWGAWLVVGLLRAGRNRQESFAEIPVDENPLPIDGQNQADQS